MNRRKFCVSSAAAAISIAAAGPARLAAGRAPPIRPGPSTLSVQLYKFIYDDRYPAARAFGAASEHAYSTAGTAAIRGDVTALWARDLRCQWLAGGGAIAGMTTARALFCLEQVAKDHWMRVLIRAEHAISEGHEIAHRLTAPEAMITPTRSALAAADWPAQMPAALAACRGWDGAPRVTTVLASAGRRRWALTDPMLVSFVIA